MAKSPAVKRPAKARKAGSKPASGPAQGPIGNTGGVYVPVPKPNPAGGSTKIPIVPQTKEEKSFLEKKQEQLQGKIDDWVEAQGSSKMSMAAGAMATALNQVLFPTSLWELVPVGKAFKLVKKGKQAADAALAARRAEKATEAAADANKAGKARKAEQAAEKEVKEAKKAGETSGGTVHGKKRKPSRRCELLPYEELQCEEGQEAHHVVPDWMLRLGKRGGPERIPGLPSLANGPAICMEGGSGNEHNTAHKHIDKPAQRIARGGGATGTAGTLQLGQAKKLSARSIEKATKGQCSKDDIKQQLDKMIRAPDNATVRGVRDSRKVTEAIKSATTRTTGDI